jgi:hypothetical protein
MANTINSNLLQSQMSQFNGTRYNGLQLGRGVQKSVIWQILAADLLALPGTKLQLVAAPNSTPPSSSGQSNFILLVGATYFQYKYNTTAYTLGNADNAFQIEYTGKTTALATQAATGLMTLTADAGVRPTTVNPGIITTANSANLGLELTLVGTTPALTLGDGLLYVQLDYTVAPIFP